MSTETEITQLQAGMAALEAQRTILGDAVVEAALSALRAKLAALSAQPQSQQRKQATVLFADVSGFTTLSETMDVEDVAGVINDLWAVVDKAILDHGGYIDKHIGDAVMAVWGARDAREDDPERAVRAALAMQAAVAHFCQTHHAPLALRIGINTGPVILGPVGTTGEFTAMGDAVNLASRLEHAAPVGGILVSHDTYRHVRGIFDVQEQAPLAVKGKAEPVRTYIVQRAKPRAFRMATRGVEGVETRMVGREAELDVLRQAFTAAIGASQTGVVTVIGEAGVGKSRLLYEFDNWIELRPEEITYFKGRGTPNTQHVPYSLFRDLFALRFDILDSDSAAVALEKFQAGMAGSLDPDHAAIAGHWLGFDFSASEAVSRLLGTAGFAQAAQAYLTRYFRHVVAEGPAVVFLEDIHWADDPSLDLAQHLVAALPTAPLLVVALARPAFFERRRGWGEGSAAFRAVRLSPLSREAAQALVDEVLQRVDAIPAGLRDLIVNSAEGNPFYVEEMVKMLIEQGVIERDVVGAGLRPAPTHDDDPTLVGAGLRPAPTHDDPTLVGAGLRPAPTHDDPTLVGAGLRPAPTHDDPTLVGAGLRPAPTHDDPTLVGAGLRPAPTHDDPTLVGAGLRPAPTHDDDPTLVGAGLRPAPTHDDPTLVGAGLRPAPTHDDPTLVGAGLRPAPTHDDDPTLVGAGLRPAPTHDDPTLVGAGLRPAPTHDDPTLVGAGLRPAPTHDDPTLVGAGLRPAPTGGQDVWRVRADRLAGLTVPPTLTSLLQARLDGLPRPEREALQRAAVVGRLFWDDCVAGLLETERVAIEPTLDAIQGRELIFQREHSTFTRAGEYIFKHALLRDVAYETVLLKYRAEFHGKVARWLEENAGERIGEYLGVIAEHFAQAGEFDRAAGYQQQSGEQALRAAAFRPARAAFERALALRQRGTAAPGAALPHYLGLGEACYRLSDFPAASDALSRALAFARDGGDIRAQAEALSWTALVAISVGRATEASPLLEEALTLARPVGGATLAQVLIHASNHHWQQGELDTAEVYAEEALRLCQGLGDVLQQGSALRALGVIAGLRGDFDTSIRHFEAGIALARQIGDRAQESKGLANLGATRHYAGDYAGAVADYRASFEVDQELGLTESLAYTAHNLADVYNALGQLGESRRFAVECVRLARPVGATPLQLAALVPLAEVLLKEGQTGRALALLGLARSHPSTPNQKQIGIRDALATVTLDPAAVEAAMAAGAALDFDTVVGEVLDGQW